MNDITYVHNIFMIHSSDETEVRHELIKQMLMKFDYAHHMWALQDATLSSNRDSLPSNRDSIKSGRIKATPGADGMYIVSLRRGKLQIYRPDGSSMFVYVDIIDSSDWYPCAYRNSIYIIVIDRLRDKIISNILYKIDVDGNVDSHAIPNTYSCHVSNGESMHIYVKLEDADCAMRVISSVAGEDFPIHNMKGSMVNFYKHDRYNNLSLNELCQYEDYLYCIENNRIGSYNTKLNHHESYRISRGMTIIGCGSSGIYLLHTDGHVMKMKPQPTENETAPDMQTINCPIPNSYTILAANDDGVWVVKADHDDASLALCSERVFWKHGTGKLIITPSINTPIEYVKLCGRDGVIHTAIKSILLQLPYFQTAFSERWMVSHDQKGVSHDQKGVSKSNAYQMQYDGTTIAAFIRLLHNQIIPTDAVICYNLWLLVDMVCFDHVILGKLQDHLYLMGLYDVKYITLLWDHRRDREEFTDMMVDWLWLHHDILPRAQLRQLTSDDHDMMIEVSLQDRLKYKCKLRYLELW